MTTTTMVLLIFGSIVLGLLVILPLVANGTIDASRWEEVPERPSPHNRYWRSPHGQTLRREARKRKGQ